MRKSIKVLFVLLFISSLTSSIANAEELQYNHVFTLESPNPEDHAWFGARVKISGDIIIVSEEYADVDEILEAGKVYIYNTNGELVSTLQSPTPGNNNNFGIRFDLHGDIIVIREMADIGEIREAGEAHVFTTDGTYQHTIQSPDPKIGGYFGTAGIYDDMIVIWENRDEGVVYMFNKEGKYLQTLLSPTPIVQSAFGRTLEVGESLILIGEYGKNCARADRRSQMER